jgi:hypothetical protein
MPNFPPGYVHKSGPVAALYHSFSIRCHVDQEHDKAYYWPTLARLYDLIEPLVRGWADVRFNSEQALERRVGNTVDADGCFRLASRKAPTGGLQKLTRERLELAATRYLADNAHLIAKFENCGNADIRFFPPKGPERVHFFLHEIIGSRARLKGGGSQMFQFMPHDFRLQVGSYHHYQMSRADLINQVLTLYFWQGILERDEIFALVREIGVIAGAVHIWHAESRFMGEEYIDGEGCSRLHYSVFEAFEDAVAGRNGFGGLWVDLLAK